MAEKQPVFSGELKISELFPLPGIEQWRKEAVRSLRGRDPDSFAVVLPEGFSTQVLYTSGDVPEGPGMPGKAPYLRGRLTDVPEWTSCALIDAEEHEECREMIAFARARDVGALWMRFSDLGRAGIALQDSFDTLFEGIDHGKMEVFLDGGGAAAPLAAGFLASLVRRDLDVSSLRGSFGLDPLGTLASRSRLPGGLAAYRNATAGLMSWAARHCPDMKTLCLSSIPFSGASAVEELGCLLASTADVLRSFSDMEFDPEEISRNIVFRVSIGRDFFVGIAKLRALRMLWASLGAHCGIENGPPPVHAVTSEVNLTRADRWVNLMRGTVETFSAVAGGADLITTLPMDAVIGESTDLGRRMALNTQTILREECHLGRVIDPGGGSYYIESLSRTLARSAWDFFRAIEKSGGLEASLRSGAIQEEIRKKRAEIDSDIAHRKIPVTGVSTWALPDEVMPERRETSSTGEFFPFPVFEGRDWVDTAIGAILEGRKTGPAEPGDQGSDQPVTPFPGTRYAESFENLKDRSSALRAAGKKTDVVLLCLGIPSEFIAREAFAVNFFAAAGIRTRSIKELEGVEDVIRAYRPLGVSRVCLCSSDMLYSQLVPELSGALKQAGAKKIYLAGKPGPAETRLESIDDFIHSGCDVLGFLSRVLEEMEAER